ncbi:uncharacterized protein LOC144100031 isoform X3 [Amblyomma americanum]
MASEFTDTSRLTAMSQSTSQLTDTSRFNTTSLADQSAMASQPMSVPQYYPPPDLLTVQTQVAGDIHHLASAAPALARIIEAQIAAERQPNQLPAGYPDSVRNGDGLLISIRRSGATQQCSKDSATRGEKILY